MALAGVWGHIVEVEADIEYGLFTVLLVGLPDTTLREARDRIRSAIVHRRQTWPQLRMAGRHVARQPAEAQQRLRFSHTVTIPTSSPRYITARTLAWQPQLGRVCGVSARICR